MAAAYQGVRVVELTHNLAAPMAGQLLADQGADVIAVHRPGHEPQQLLDLSLARNKRLLALDIKSDSERQQLWQLLKRADVLITNFRPGVLERLGLSAEQLKEVNPGLIQIQLPGFSATDEQHKQLAATEGMLAAASGLFREISPVRDLLQLPPVYTPIPLPSVYAAVHAATAVGAALIARRQDGKGEVIEIPLFDAAMSALSGLLMKIENQPVRYDVPPLPKKIQNTLIPALSAVVKRMPSAWQEKTFTALQGIMPPLFQNYRCKDGRLLFICALEHSVQTINALKTFGIYDQLKQQGLEFGSPMDNSGSKNNVMNIALLSPRWKSRIKKAISAAALTKTAEQWETLLENNKVPAGVVRSSDEWLDIPALNQSGLFVDVQHGEKTLRQPGGLIFMNQQHPGEKIQAGSRVLFSEALEGWPEKENIQPQESLFDRSKGLLSGKYVLDLANVIAGPVATRTLAELGADVIKVDAPNPQIGPRMTMQFGIDCSQGKRAIIIDLKKHTGQILFQSFLDKSDLLVHNFLDSSVANLGLNTEQLQARQVSSVQISAFGAPLSGGWELRPAFDPVIQAISGITRRYGCEKNPQLHAVASCIDYLTGYSAAFAAVTAMYQADQTGQAVAARTSLCAASNYVQYPFNIREQGAKVKEHAGGQTCLGDSADKHMYKTADGWIYFESRHADKEALTPYISVPVEKEALAKFFSKRSTADWQNHFNQEPNIICQPVNNFADLRQQFALQTNADAAVNNNSGAIKVLHYRHPSGYQVATLSPSWMRIQGAAVARQTPAPSPGENSRHILQNAGLNEQQIDQLYADKTVQDSYTGVSEYLPS